jgi:hypothetical protein
VLARTVNQCVNALQIWVPAAAAGIVGVADHISKTRPFAANSASHCHDDSSPHLLKLGKVVSLAEPVLLRTLFDLLVVAEICVAEKKGSLTLYHYESGFIDKYK